MRRGTPGEEWVATFWAEKTGKRAKAGNWRAHQWAESEQRGWRESESGAWGEDEAGGGAGYSCPATVVGANAFPFISSATGKQWRFVSRRWHNQVMFYKDHCGCSAENWWGTAGVETGKPVRRPGQQLEWMEVTWTRLMTHHPKSGGQMSETCETDWVP